MTDSAGGATLYPEAKETTDDLHNRAPGRVDRRSDRTPLPVMDAAGAGNMDIGSGLLPQRRAHAGCSFMLTPQMLNEQARTMPFEQLMRELEPLISKWSHKHVAGFEQEDVRQELLEVLVLTQRFYDPAKGSFLNLLLVSFSNRIQKLWKKGTRQTLPISKVSCRDCEAIQPPQRWGVGYRCLECGSRKMSTERQSTSPLWENSNQQFYEEIGFELVEAADQFKALPLSRQQQIVEEARL